MLASKCLEQNLAHAPIEIVNGDMLEIDWFDADIIYFSSVCFPDSLVDGCCDLMTKLKPGTRIISLKPLPDRAYLELYATLKVRMTWGLH